MNKTEKTDFKGYTFIKSQILHTGITPSLREIGREVGYNSPRSVQLMLERLERRGLLSYKNGIVQLSVESSIMHSEKTIDIPLVGSVACGSPSLAEQEIEAIVQISTKIAKPGYQYFLLRAVGTSMNLSGINHGDLVLVRQQQTANENDRVVALINDDATIKHIHYDRENGIIVLRPNSTDQKHKPIVVTEDLILQGVVAAVLPKSIL